MPNSGTTTTTTTEHEQTIAPDWSMFEKICKLGEGGNGTVYKVKALKTSIFSEEIGSRIEIVDPE